MIAQYKFYLDGIPVDEPRGWDKLEDTLRRDDGIKAMLFTQDVSVDFIGNAYRYLKRKKDTENVLSQTTLLIKEAQSFTGGQYDICYEGVIFTSDIEFTAQTLIAKCKIQDNGYYSKVNGNKSLEVYLDATISKNGIQISPCPQHAVAMFDPCDGTAIGGGSTTWKVFDVFAFLIRFFTDDEMEFDSPVFGPSGEFRALTISTGRWLRDASPPAGTKAPLVTFAKLLSDCDKKLNLAFYIDETGVKPKLVLDYEDNLRVNETALTIPHVNEITTTTDVNRLKSSVRFGSGAIIEKGAADCATDHLAFYDEISWVGVKEESYIILGKANIDSELNLKGDFIISSNVIQQVVADNVEDYDDDLFFVDCDPDSTGNALQGFVLTDTYPVYYNTRLYNDKVALRFLKGVPNSIAQRLGGGSVDLFKAVATTNLQNYITLGAFDSTREPNRFDDDYSLGNDASNNYGNATIQGNPVAKADSKFTATAEGLYFLKAFLKINFILPSSNPGQLYTITNVIKVYDSLNVLKSTQSKVFYPSFNVTTSSVVDFDFTAPCFMVAGDYAVSAFKGRFDSPGGSTNKFIDIISGSYFELVGTSLIGGIFQTYAPEDYPIIKHRFTCPLSLSNYRKIIGNKKSIGKRFSKIAVTNNETSVSGWIDQLKYNRLTSKAEFTLTSDQR